MKFNQTPFPRKAILGIKVNHNSGFRGKPSGGDAISTGCLALDPEVGYPDKGFITIPRGYSLIVFGKSKKWDLSPADQKKIERKLTNGNISCEILSSIGQDFVQVKNKPETRINLDDIGLTSALEMLISKL